MYGMKRLIEIIEKENVGIYKTIMCCSDFHVPFQKPIETFKDYVNKIDILVLNGDILDQQSISKFSKIYRINPIEEMIQGRKYIIDLINYIKPKEVYFTKGNHEERFGAYLAKKLDCELKELLPDTALDYLITEGFNHYDKINGTKIFYEPIKEIFKKENIVIHYNRDWKVKINKTWFAHPSAFSSSPLKTCEKAMAYFHKTDKEIFDTVVLAHTHRIGYEKKGFINLYEQGACCQTDKMRYVDGKLSDPQKEGFVVIYQNENGDNIESKSKLIKLN